MLKLFPLTETITLSIVVAFGTMNQDFIPEEAEIEEALDQEFEIIEPNEDNGLLRKIRN